MTEAHPLVVPDDEPQFGPPPHPEQWSPQQRQLSIEVYTKQTRVAARVMEFGRIAGVRDPEGLWSETVIRYVNRSPDILPENRAAYIFTIARNLAFSELRRRSVSTVPYEEVIAADPVTEFESEIATRLTLEPALQRLPPRQRSVMELVLMKGLAPTEAAAILGVTKGTIKSQLFHAKANMRLIFAGMGITNPYDSTQNQRDR